MSQNGFAQRARAAIDAGEEPEDLEILRGRRPRVLDRHGVVAITMPLLAGAAWAISTLWERGPGADTFDAGALLVRLLAYGLTLRAILLGASLIARLRVWARAREHALVLGRGALLYVFPGGELVLEPAEVADVREAGAWGERPGARRWSDVYLLTRAGSPGHPFVAIPPVLDRTPGVLAERLMRWRGAREAQRVDVPPAKLASKVYDDAAEGRLEPGSVTIRHGNGWLRRGPYTTVLMSLLFFETFLRKDAGAVIDPTLPLALAAGLLLVPVGWILLSRRHITPRRGLALVLTPAEVLLRTRGGILRASWKALERVHVQSTPTWSLLDGYHQARHLVLERSGSSPIRYDEAYLGVPAEVAQGMMESYRRGTLP